MTIWGTILFNLPPARTICGDISPSLKKCVPVFQFLTISLKARPRPDYRCLRSNSFFGLKLIVFSNWLSQRKMWSQFPHTVTTGILLIVPIVVSKTNSGIRQQNASMHLCRHVCFDYPASFSFHDRDSSSNPGSPVRISDSWSRCSLRNLPLVSWLLPSTLGLSI